MMPNSSTANSRLAFADGLRGFAALWVVLYHLAEGGHIEAIKAAMPHLLFSVVFEWGHLGVPVFFVLSGFVMGLTAQNVVFDRSNAFRFIGRRLLRLVPPYYFAIFFAILFLLVKSKVTGSAYASIEPITILNHLLFIQGILKLPFINFVFWTLCIEVQFYIVFAILLWGSDSLKGYSSAKDLRLWILSVASVFSLLWPLKIVTTPHLQGTFLEFWYSFLLGTLVCWASLRREGGGRLAIGFCIGLLLIEFYHGDGFAITSAATALALLYASFKNRMESWLNFAWLQWLGLNSYSLYLLHNPVTGASVNVLKRMVPSGIFGELVIGAISVTACLIIAQISYLLIERPSIRLSHRIKLKKQTQVTGIPLESQPLRPSDPSSPLA